MADRGRRTEQSQLITLKSFLNNDMCHVSEMTSLLSAFTLAGCCLYNAYSVLCVRMGECVHGSE